MIQESMISKDFDGNPMYEIFYLRQPFYEESITILDSPPIAPDVNLVTYRGESDKLLIMFNSMVDKKYETPIEILESDAELIDRQRQAQWAPGNNMLIFESDDAPHSFEILRTTTKPQKWSDFANTEYRIATTNGDYSCSYTDTITPNTKYYYCFRTRDVHGFISNPTEIYEFEMLKDGETIYPRIRIVDFDPPAPPMQRDKSFKKYIKIGVSTLNTLLPEEYDVNSLDDLEGVHLQVGNANIPVWGKNFKFRIKSKNTGKMIDINVSFNTKNVIKV